jgi:hypothetical protein
VLRQFGVLSVFLMLVFGWGAAHAATQQSAAFRVTLTGTLSKDWTVARTVAAECDEVTTHTGHWKLTLATGRPTKLVIVGSSGPGRPLRISPGVVRSISGSATRTGSVVVNTNGPRCVRSIKRSTCKPARRSFRGATVRLTSPGRGTARFARLQGASAVHSFRGSCPEEPADIRSLRTDLGLADAPLSAADAFDRNVPSFFISGDTVQETTIEGAYDGKVVERVRWKLTFTRLAH